MVSRIHNRNTGGPEGLFAQNQSVENNTFNSIDGATALKLDEKFEVSDKVEESSISNLETNLSPQKRKLYCRYQYKQYPNGVSIENASYMEKTDHT